MRNSFRKLSLKMNLIQQEIVFDEVATLEALQNEAHGVHLGTIFKGSDPTGDELKEEGQAKAMRKKAARLYRDMLVETLKVFPVGRRISIENLTGIVGRPPEGVSNNVVGGAVSFMARKGLISRTGKMLKPARKERHSNLIPEWEIRKYL